MRYRSWAVSGGSAASTAARGIPAGDVHLPDLIAAAGEGDEGQGDLAARRAMGSLIEALLPQLVKAPPLRAAGPGADRGPPKRPGLRPPVDVAQGQVSQAAGGNLLFADGVVPASDGLHLPVEQADVDPCRPPGR